MHEFVLSGRQQKKKGVKTLDIAKRLLDFGLTRRLDFINTTHRCDVRRI